MRCCNRPSPWPGGTRRLEQGVEVAFEPVVDGVLAEMTERRIADVVHQAGHFHQAFQRALQPVQADLRGTRAQMAEQRADDETPGLLHFQGMGQAAAHRVALQREDLGLLLQRRTAAELTMRPRSLSNW